ncbi:MAG TPA: aldo/keto reductase [Leptolyngbyaceae cyanobacterium M33_DOE_097]|uniref:Aldo/keto reductase n=1 Tax=Oscillatoriales cyanobacterium SpSt-418 TaxID=2282169 RepID=A0A7C3PNV1_9CYAN|nr:aldo/keto reductase [Leptolyngbyaceae cyanobacterium M33_DOE_097]
MNVEPSRPNPERSLSRRTTLRLMGLGAVSTVIPTVVNGCGIRVAQGQASSPVQNQASDLLMKEIPRTKERIPAIGMGTFLTFDVLQNQPRNNLQQVMRRFWENGGRMIDVSPLYGMSEVNVGEFAETLGFTDELLIANKIWATGDYLGDRSHAQQQFEQSLKRLSRDRLDLLQVHSLVNVEMMVPLLKEWKQENKIRYIGVTHHDLPLYAAPIERWIKNGDLDFVQIRYSIFERGVEDRILPAAAEQGTAVLVNMPFEKARLFEVVQSQPFPDFAREIGCENWAQFFLKYVISHPAVTAAIPATTNPNHVVENLGALRGPLPDNQMRTRMVQYMQNLPGFDRIAQMPWYPGKKFAGLVRLPGLAATQNAGLS